jgi:hypothetical protein
VTLCAPPAPISHPASMASCVPSGRSNPTSTRRPAASTDDAEMPRSTTPPSSVSRSTSICSVRHWDKLHWNSQGPPTPANAISPTAPGPHRTPWRIPMDRGAERRLEDPRPGEDLERPRLERRGAGWRCGSGWRSTTRVGHAVPRELGRDEQASRPGTDHEHLGLRLAHAAIQSHGPAVRQRGRLRPASGEKVRP